MIDVKYAIIGDVHSSFNELQELITKIHEKDGNEDRKIIFVGDLFDRGSDPIKLFDWIVKTNPISVRGNHDNKLLKFLNGGKVTQSHGLKGTIEALATYCECSVEALQTEPTPEKLKPFKEWLIKLPYFMVLPPTTDHTQYKVIVHAATTSRDITNYSKEDLPNKAKKAIEATCLYGFTTGEKDASGFPVRKPWDHHWDDCPNTIVIHGHTPSDKGPVKLGKYQNVINVDTGCCFGFELTSFLLPEEEFIYVKSKQTYKYGSESD